ncbi:MAG: lysozyme inhibitor LprI family protein [Sporomusaceae bacterium]|nr:lysozyme inhibitor LprI family protein [Sporomusaceae bacterium]
MVQAGKKLLIALAFSLICLSNYGTAGASGAYDMSGDFIKQFNQNALDRDYQLEFKQAKTTLDYVQLESKYIKLWEQELDNTYQNLWLQLGDKDRALLADTEENWLRWHNKEAEFANTFLSRQGGSIWPVVTARTYKERLRERTMELMEYRYLIRHEVGFLYNGISDSATLH